MPTTYAWCFDHGRLHVFPADKDPWCTAAWIIIAATTKEQAIEAKRAAYGEVRFLDELPANERMKIIEARTPPDAD
jgi:hypothetical protein